MFWKLICGSLGPWMIIKRFYGMVEGHAYDSTLNDKLSLKIQIEAIKPQRHVFRY